jgi:hypothetical protein
MSATRKKWGTIIGTLVLGGIFLIGLWTLFGKNPPPPVSSGPKDPGVGVESKGDTPPDNGAVYRVHVLWEDDRQPAAGTSVTLVCEKSREGNKTVSSAPQELKTDLSGLASFQLPEGVSQVKIEASRAYAFSETTPFTVTAAHETTLLLKKAYECFGTVYAVSDLGTTVPIQGAIVSLSEQKDFRTPLDAKGAGRARDGVLSDDRGQFRIVSPVSQVVLQASKGPLVAPLLEKDHRPHTLRHEALNGPYDLVLEKGCSLLVSVFRKDTMEGIEDARVEVEGTHSEKPFATNKTGECEIQGLSQGMQKVAVWADGYTRESALVALSPKEGNLAVFTLVPAGQIRVFTVDDKDQPFGGVGVSLETKMRGEIERIATDDRGSGELNNAPLNEPLLLRPTDIGAYFFPPQACVFEKGKDVVEVKLRCYPREQKETEKGNCWIQGQVIDETTRQPIPGLTVIGEGTEKKVLTDGKGEFYLDGLKGPEQINFAVLGKGYTPAIRKGVPASTFVVVEMVRSVSVIGKVLDSKSNEPVSSFSVKVEGDLIPNERSYSPLRIFSLEGTFTLEDLCPGSNVGFTIQADGYETITRWIQLNKSDEPQEILFILNPAAGVTGKVVDAETRQPIAGAQVTYEEGVRKEEAVFSNHLENHLENADFKIYGITDEKGDFTLNINSNSGTFNVFAEGYARTVYPATSRGDVPLEIPLDKASTLKVRFRQAENTPIFVGIGMVETQLQNGGRNQKCRYFEYEEQKPDTVAWDSLPAGKSMVGILVANTPEVIKMTPAKTMILEYACLQAASGKMYNPGSLPEPNVNSLFWTEILLSVDLPSGRETVLEIPADSAISGHLTLNGNPVQGIVLFEGKTDPVVYRYVTCTDSNGFYRIPTMASGDYTVFVGRLEGKDEKTGGSEYTSPCREIFRISGTTQKDFELEGKEGHRLTGKLRLDSIAPPYYTPGRENFLTLRVEQIGDSGESSSGLTQYGKSLIQPDGSFCMKGRFRGTYKFILENRVNVRIDPFFEIAQPRTFGNLKGDQDLGEIDTKSIGPFSLTATLLNSEYLIAGNLYAHLVVEKMSTPPCQFGLVFSPTDGTANTQGLFPGEYRIRLVGSKGGGYQGIDFDTKMMTIQDNVTLQYDARELVKKPEENGKGKGQ